MRLDLPDLTEAKRWWAHAEPFPHVVIQGVLSPADAAACGDEFPGLDDTGWHTFKGPLEHGKQEARAELAGPNVAALHALLAADEFVGWLRALSGIDTLVADPSRHGGGIHQSGPDARLGLHVDFSVHPVYENLVREVNVIVFVGDHDHWLSEWGGHLILGADRERIVAPLPGTLVVFAASDMSWHGHPVPMSVDAPVRRSVPGYYYRPLGDGETVEAHSTRFLETS